MTNAIHPTAIIERGAQLGAGVKVGPYCIVGPDVKLADNVTLHAHVVIAGRTTIGEGTQIYPFSSIGHPPQDLKYRGEASELIIGKNNVIREHTLMNTGTEGGGMKTIIGDNGLFMGSTHVAHDCLVGNNVIMAQGAVLGGHVAVGDHAVLGGLSAVHQFVRIGEYAIVGGVTAVDTDVIPFGRVKGGRAELMGLNLVGLERGGFTKEQIRSVQRAFNSIFGEDGTFEQRLERAEREFAGDAAVQGIVKFARAKTRFPLCQPPRKAA